MRLSEALELNPQSMAIPISLLSNRQKMPLLSSPSLFELRILKKMNMLQIKPQRVSIRSNETKVMMVEPFEGLL